MGVVSGLRASIRVGRAAPAPDVRGLFVRAPAESRTVDTFPDEVGQRRPDWAQLDHLVRGARTHGYTEAQIEYLMSCMGITWAKACFASERARR